MTKESNTAIVEINPEHLLKDPNHPRQDSGNLDSLRRSVKKEGILTPITVVKFKDKGFHVIDGFRRVEVARALGLKTVPCIVTEESDPAISAHRSYVLNMVRNQLNEIEIALHIKKMKDTFGHSHTELEMMGYGSKATISKMISLLELPQEVQNQIATAELTKAHGENLLKLKDSEKIKKTAKLAVANDWSAKKTGTVVEKHMRKVRDSKKADKKERVPAQNVPGVYFKDAKDMSELPDASIGCVVTSTPYGVGKEYEEDTSYAEHLENVEAVLTESARVLIPGGVMAINMADILDFEGANGKSKVKQIQSMTHVYQGMLRKHGVYLADEVIWMKDANPFTRDPSRDYNDDTKHTEYRIVPQHERVLVFRKKGERTAPSEDIALQSMLTREEWKVYAPSVWQIDRVHNAEGHPAQFPEELVRRIIKMYSFVGETVLDPFLGSGTTVKVARELNRDGVGYEKDTRYKATIMKKLGVEEESTGESVKRYADQQLQELEDNQPKEPEVEVMASEGMKEFAENATADKELEAVTA